MARRTRIQVKRKKLSDKEVHELAKQDPLLKMMNQSLDFFKQRGQVIIAVIIVAAVGFFAIRGYLSYRANQEMDAGKILATAEEALYQNELDKAASVLDSLLKDHSGTRTSKQAEMLKASVLLAKGNTEEAIQLYRDLLSRNRGEIARELKFSLANALQSKGDAEEALRLYEELEKDGAFVRQYELLYRKGQVLESLNQYDGARESYSKIPSDSESVYYGLARQRLEWIRAMANAA
ncbi:MAG TPA: tetratricopeptide repeat protein [bacterium]|nr:tetratricopeptide repeat protein [bacterium]